MGRTLAGLALLLGLMGAGATAGQTPPPPPVAVGGTVLPDELWVVREGARVRLDREALREALGRGELDADTLVWVDGAWRRAGEVGFLRPLLPRREEVTLAFTVPPDTPENRRRLVGELWRALELGRTVDALLQRTAEEAGADLARLLPPHPERARIAAALVQTVYEVIRDAAYRSAREAVVEALVASLDTRELAFQLAVNRHPLIRRARDKLLAAVPAAMQRADRAFRAAVDGREAELCARVRTVLARFDLAAAAARLCPGGED